MFRCFLISSAAVVFMLNSAQAENWSEFRGPTGQGIVKEGGLPLEWSPTKNVVWKQAIPGNGWSSPIVVDGRIYLTTSVPSKDSKDGKDLSLEALCLDANSGKVIWEKGVFQQDSKAPTIHTKNSPASPTPLVNDKRLYVHFGHLGTACLDLEGKILWRNTELKYAPVHGNGGTPILVGDALIFSCDGGDKQFVVALDKNNGKILWKTDRKATGAKKFAFSTPLLITVAGKQQVVSPGPNAVCAYDPADGKEIWRVTYNGYSVIPRPVFAHGLVFVCTGFDKASLLAIRPDGQGDITKTHVAWTLGKGVPFTASLLVVGDELYMVSDKGNACCLDARTGKEHWQKHINGDYSASPVFADGKIYFQNEQGTAFVIKAGTKFEQLAKNALDERSFASFAAVDGALILRTENNLYRIQAR